MKSILSVTLLLLILGACQSNQSSKPLNESTASGHEVVVKEVIQVGSYTYLRVAEGKSEIWLATPPVEAKEGEKYYYQGGMEMTNFKSKELNRTFESIIFLENISSSPTGESDHANQAMVSPGSAGIKDGKKEISVTPAEGAITIAELYANKKTYEGKTVRIKVQVTKFSPEIMNTNWIHAQDGTESDGNYDLTITSKTNVNVGDVVIFEGKMSLDKDFGYGYFYAVLMEEAVVVN